MKLSEKRFKQIDDALQNDRKIEVSVLEAFSYQMDDRCKKRTGIEIHDTGNAIDDANCALINKDPVVKKIVKKNFLK